MQFQLSLCFAALRIGGIVIGGVDKIGDSERFWEHLKLLRHGGGVRRPTGGTVRLPPTAETLGASPKLRLWLVVEGSWPREADISSTPFFNSKRSSLLALASAMKQIMTFGFGMLSLTNSCHSAQTPAQRMIQA